MSKFTPRPQKSFYINIKNEITSEEADCEMLFFRYINFGEDAKKDDDDFDLEEPTNFLKNLEEGDYEDLIEDIKVCSPTSFMSRKSCGIVS